MDNQNYINILDFGSSRIRFSVFNNDLKEVYTESENVKLENNLLNHMLKTRKIIKNAEKKITNHINDSVITLDLNELFTIDLSLNKNLDGKLNIYKVYNSLILELNQIIETNYNKYQIIHTILDKCIVDNKLFYEIPKDVKVINNIKIDFKILCFPKNIINYIKNSFKKNNINITNFFCTSYIKSKSYLKNLNFKNASFLDIGFEKTSLICFLNKKLKFIQVIPIGGNHITKDISNVFNLSLDEAEKIKRLFNKSENEFSYQQNVNNNISIKDIISKNISIDTLKKVILYRVQEIIDLSYNKYVSNSYKICLKNSDLFLIGNGSLLFKDNSFHLKDSFEFKNISFFNETDYQICNSGLTYYLNNYQIQKKNYKKQGIFERFFNYFAK